MKKHRTDWLSLSFGLLFLVIVLGWLTSDSIDVGMASLGWLAAGALILFGVIGLLGALRGSRAPAEPAPATEAAAAEAAASDPDLTAEVHADIVRELLSDTTVRLSKDPATAPDDETAHRTRRE